MRFGRQYFDRLQKGQALGFHQELEGIASGGATKTVVNLFVGADCK